jgi:hypothetical protein
MVWFFERSGQFIRCETRDGRNGRWELVVVDADGRERVEQFEDSSALDGRVRELECGFRATGWFGPHGRFA